MIYKNLMLDSLKESFHLILKNKRWLVLLFVLEIFFLISLSVVSYNYQIKIVEHSTAIFEYISKLKLDDAAVADNLMQQKSILGDDPLLISRELSEILKNFRLMLASIFVLMLVFLSLGWGITTRTIHKISLKNFIKSCVQIFFVLLFYLGSVFVFLYYLINIYDVLIFPLALSQIALAPSVFGAKYILFLIVLGVSLYFMFISLSLLHKTGLKDIAQETLVVGIKKAHYALGIYAAILLLPALAVAVFIMFFEKSMLVLFFSTVLLIFSLVFGRFFMVKTFEKID